MSGVGEAGLVLGIISSIISIIDATKQIYEAVKDEKGLPKNFKRSATKLPLISKLLEDAERYVESNSSLKDAFTPTLKDCEVQAAHLQELFKKVMPEEGDSRGDRYMKAARSIGKGGRIESLVGRILENLQLLSTNFPEVTTPRSKDQLTKAIEEVAEMEPSLPDDFEGPAYAHYGSGAQYISTGSGTQNINNVAGNQYSSQGHQYFGTTNIVNNSASNKDANIDEINQACLRSLRCPDAQLVKNRLKSNKDKLLPQCIDWVLQDPQYISWQDTEHVCLLLIRGGAGKGKTMMSISLVERLSAFHDTSTIVIYFFCQNADYEINTIEAIIKGLILQLVNQQKELMESLRRHWDHENDRFDKDVSDWRILWYIFLEMLEQCQYKYQRVYIVVDALDECEGDGMADFLKCLVRTGLHHSPRVLIKWLFTSRPLDSAEQELLVGTEQVLVSLELNSDHISQSISTYITSKVNELDHRHHYGEKLRQDIQFELSTKAENTFLWISLVCKQLEDVHGSEAIATIQASPSGLDQLYQVALQQLCSDKSRSPLVDYSVQLLKMMMLVYRPLNKVETAGLMKLSHQPKIIDVIINRCASFFMTRGDNIEFVHKSARDYLAGKVGQSILASCGSYGQGEVALGCLSYLTKQLKMNLVNLSRPDSTREPIQKDSLVTSMDYAATFWVQHLSSAKHTTEIQAALIEQIELFFRTKLLEWLECLSLLDKLSRAVEALRILTDITDVKQNPYLSILVQDAQRFLLRHFRTLNTWPLQVYSSAIIFSPQTSEVRKNNLDKVLAAGWLRKVPQTEDAWSCLIQTLRGHSDRVTCVAYSPDGKQIASGSMDKTIKLWDATTGDLQKTLVGHLKGIWRIIFSPDSKMIASKSFGDHMKLWDTITGDLHMILTSDTPADPFAFPSKKKQTAFGPFEFSPSNKQLLSTYYGKDIGLWDVSTGGLQETLEGHTGLISCLAYSPDGQQIASGSEDETIRLWNTATGNLQKILKGHLHSVKDIVFSSSSQRIASSSYDDTIKIWDTTTGNLQKTLISSRPIMSMGFLPDNKYFVSTSHHHYISLWDTTLKDPEATLSGHTDLATCKTFSPDGKQITASESRDNIVKSWDASIGGLQNILFDYPSLSDHHAFSPDGKQVASTDEGISANVELWDTTLHGLYERNAYKLSKIRFVKFSPDCKRILSVYYDSTVKLCDVATGRSYKIFPLGIGIYIQFSPNSKYIGSATVNMAVVKLWNASTGDLHRILVGHSSNILCLAFSPDSRQIASGAEDGTIKLWDTVTGNLQKTLIVNPHDSIVPKIWFSPNSKQIASRSEHGTIKLWDTVTGHLQIESLGGADNVYSLQFLPDGKQVVLVSSVQIQLWNTTTGKLQTRSIHTKDFNNIKNVQFSPDGKQIASSTFAGDIKLSNLDTCFKSPRLVNKLFRKSLKNCTWQAEIKADDRSKSLKFSEDGQYLITDIGQYIITKGDQIKIERFRPTMRNLEFESLGNLGADDEWIYYGGLPVLRLPPEFHDMAFDARGDHMTIHLRNGRVLIFEVDRRKLHLALST